MRSLIDNDPFSTGPLEDEMMEELSWKFLRDVFAVLTAMVPVWGQL